MIKITSRSFSYSSYNIVMEAISLSFLFGNAAARLFMGQLRETFNNWTPTHLVKAVGLSAESGA
jgi:hypothetical protein